MEQIPSILVVDDDRVAAELLSEVFQKEGYRVAVATNGGEAIKMGEAGRFDVVITDLKMPEMSGIDVMNAFKRIDPDTDTIVLTAFGSFESAIEAIRGGAYDYIAKPFKMDEIKAKVSGCLEQKKLMTRKPAAYANAPDDFSFKSIIGASRKMLEIYKTVARVSGSDVPVFLQGERGSGKDLIARAIHDNSLRARGPFIVVNCASLREYQLEAEFFGCTRGAFANAMTDKKGFIEEAGGGTCFLEEIGEMPLAVQVKLLRVLQSGASRRIGDDRDIPVNVRFISAAHRDILVKVKERHLREDLFSRLSVVTINIPPLREHPEDIPMLSEYLLQKALKKTRKDVQGISDEAMAALKGYQWPGNIRELENVIDRTIALTSNKVLLKSDLPVELQDVREAEDAEHIHTQKGFVTLQELKLNYIEQILKHTDGNQNLAADILGIDRKTIYRTIKKLKSEVDEGEGGVRKSP